MKKNLKMELLNSEVEQQVQGGYFGMPSGAGGFADTFITQKAMKEIEEEMRTQSSSSFLEMQSPNFEMMNGGSCSIGGVPTGIVKICALVEYKNCWQVEFKPCCTIECKKYSRK